jgi:hypothetical protein
MLKYLSILAAMLGLSLSACAAVPDRGTLPASVASDLQACNVVWNSPSKDSFESMPLPGVHGAGANVWVSEGSLWIYLAHNGAYDESGALLKLGALRLTPAGVDWNEPPAFKQATDLATGTITVDSTAKDGTQLKLRLRFLGESLLIDAAASHPLVWDAAFATWRDARGKGRYTGGIADIVTPAGDALHFVHKDGDSRTEANLASSQHIAPEAMLNLLPNRSFGGALVARGGLSFVAPAVVDWQTWNGKAWSGQTVSAKEQTFCVTLGVGKNADPAQWETTARSLLTPAARQNAEAAEDNRWTEFWNRSYIFVAPRGDAKDPAFQVGRNYQLFRQMLACNQDGELPLKFNGGIFNTEPHPERIPIKLNNPSCISFTDQAKGSTPDYRRWGQMFLGQNQRWLGWGVVATGDADLLSPTTRFYRDRLPIAESRAKNLSAQGACYPEALGLDGTICVAPTGQSMCSAPHLTYHFAMGVEHAWMTLQGHSTMGTNIDADIPWMVDIVRFFDSFYRAQTLAHTKKELGDDGKLVLYPLNGLELIGGGTNTIETVAGLRRVTEGLLALPQLSAADRAFLEKVQPTLPELPTMMRDGRKVLAPAAKWQAEYNPWEFPEMYPAWPYRLVGVTHPETLQIVRDTWDTVPIRGDNRSQLFCRNYDFSWQSLVASTAAMGRADEARKRAIAKLSDAAGCARYPAFFGPGHDWMPDHNWGGSGMVGLQEMLVASDPVPNGKIHLFPAWPAAWDVRFKLHTANTTTIECELSDGKVVQLHVTPASRRKDIVLEGPAPTPPPLQVPVSQGKPATASSVWRDPGFSPASAFDGDPVSRWAVAEGNHSGWLAVDLLKPVAISRAVIMEISWPVTTRFAIEYQRDDGQWQPIVTGTALGARRELKFAPVTAQHFRLNILDASNMPNIEEFQLFKK